MILRYTVPPQGGGQRLSGVCRGELRLSDTQLRRLKAEQGLLVNGSPAFASTLLSPGDRVTAVLREEAPAYPPEPGEIRVVYEDGLMLVLDKPQGLIVHPTHSRFTGTLANRVWAYLREQGAEGCHPVNRLDRDTGGLILFAKSAWACHLLGQALSSPHAEKRYLAAIWGVPSPERGRIDLPIRRPDPRDLRREAGEPGEAASTEYELLESAEGCSLVGLRLYTGRTHQIRVHMSAMGWPLLGDRLYGTQESLARSEALGQRVQALHCCALAFPYPLGGGPLRFTCGPDWPALRFLRLPEGKSSVDGDCSLSYNISVNTGTTVNTL